MNNEEKKIVGYDPQTGQPIYEEQNTQPVQVEEPKKKSHAGLIIGIIIGVIVFLGLCLIGLFFLFGAMFTAKSTKTGEKIISNEEKTFYGESYTIKYKYPWEEKEAKLTSGESEKVLSYNNDDITVLPVGSSALDETAKAAGADFSTISGKMKLYSAFREYWGKTDNITGGSGSFNLLTDDMYYAYMKYTKGSVSGSFYLIADEDNNVLLSFNVASAKGKDVDGEALLLFKNLNVTTLYDDELANSLEQMSNWNRYKDVRTGVTLGKKKVLTGGWQVLSAGGEAYWVFKGNEYWWYKSYKDLNDNYWYGTVQVYRGKEGYKKVGLDPEKIDETLARNKNMKETDFYTTIFTPKKVIVDGEDKSSTNIQGEDWHMIWILIDHGKEGIEAQQLNVKNSETAYFVKVKD